MLKAPGGHGRRHPVDNRESYQDLKAIESTTRSIASSLYGDMPTYKGRRELVERLGKLENAVGFIQCLIWNTEHQIEKDAAEIYATDLPGYVKRALVDASFRTFWEVYDWRGHPKIKGIGKKGAEALREWQDTQNPASDTQ